MTETAGQLLSHVTPDCQWIPQASPNPFSTAPAYPWFPNNVREWTRFFRAVRLAVQQNNLPPGPFPTFATNAQPLRVEDDAKTRLYTNALFPVKGLLPQGLFGTTPTRFLGASDYVLCTNNYAVAKMPMEMKIDTYFLKREETTPTTLYVSHVVQPTDTNPTLRECIYYISQLAINDNISNRLGHVTFDNFSSNDDDDDDSSYHDPDDYDDPDYHPDDSDDSDDNGDKYVSLGKRKRTSKSTIASSSKRIITTCDAYKKQEEMKMLKHEAHIYSILKECQGHDIPRLFYNGYIYDGYLFALALQLIEDSHHIDPSRLTKKEKELIVNQLRSIHNFGVLHNDISQRNILYEPKSNHYFFIDFGLSEIVNNESPKLRKEEMRLKKLLQL
ncbi:hypothetical protein C1645_838135 [Glomus cerebriforme]|uniref:Protein kinase domain-containing protein n=1 Tax=Glomus cerebriforme TaxID=658196 RepID=A0A397S5I4_9GLOM|nr:hypothetical protein C1645_838135 [Glomus cerebriforme]